MKIGYTSGVFDLFHIGHLNILKRARSECDYLIVGVTTDEEVLRIKNIRPVIPFKQRIEIVKSIKYCDKAVVEINSDKIIAWKKYKFNIIFKGSDWKGTSTWVNYESKFKLLGVEVKYFKYTEGISTSILRKEINC
jgi:glycerol-3-phosphate cytidylyltransferase